MLLQYSRGRSLEYDISPILEKAKKGMNEDEIQSLVFADFDLYPPFDRALLLMKTGDIVHEVIERIRNS